VGSWAQSPERENDHALQPASPSNIFLLNPFCFLDLLSYGLLFHSDLPTYEHLPPPPRTRPAVGGSPVLPDAHAFAPAAQRRCYPTCVAAHACLWLGPTPHLPTHCPWDSMHLASAISQPSHCHWTGSPFTFVAGDSAIMALQTFDSFTTLAILMSYVYSSIILFSDHSCRFRALPALWVPIPHYSPFSRHERQLPHAIRTCPTGYTILLYLQHQHCAD